MAVDPTQDRQFYGRNATVKFADPLSSIGGSSPVDSQISNDTDFSADITEITITDPEASVEAENTFDGQIKNESPAEMVEIEFTMRFQDVEAFEEMHTSGGSGTTFTDTQSTTWTRVTGTQGPGSRSEHAILFKLQRTIDGTDYQINYLLNNALFVQMGEISLAADDRAELSGSAMCLVEDRVIEQNF